MIEVDTADIIAAALWTEEITSWTVEELDALAALKYANDPDVSFSDMDWVPDAGAENHGVNTDDEMFQTVGGQNA